MAETWPQCPGPRTCGAATGIHGREAPPSERVIAEHDEMFGREYRVESEGEHPDPAMREK